LALALVAFSNLLDNAFDVIGIALLDRVAVVVGVSDVAPGIAAEPPQ